MVRGKFMKSKLAFDPVKSCTLLCIACLLLSAFVSAQSPTGGKCDIHNSQGSCGDNGEVSSLVGVPETSPSVMTKRVAKAQDGHVDDAEKPFDLLKCHKHGEDLYCTGADGSEVEVSILDKKFVQDDRSFDLKSCHKHGEDFYCIGADGAEVAIELPGDHHGHDETEDEHHKDEDHSEDEHAQETGEQQSCHFHAGVEHCEDDEVAGSDGPRCEVQQREYKMDIRIGAIFIMLFTSSLAVFGPIFLSRFTKVKLDGIAFTVIKQFGTGVIIATAFIHLLTHAYLMFGNPCVGRLGYEATTNAIAMAGIFISFLIEYIGDRALQHRQAKQSLKSLEQALPVGTFHSKEAHGADTSVLNTPQNGLAVVQTSPADSTESMQSPASHHHGHRHHHHHHHHHHHGGVGANDSISVFVMECGIIFHSILIGITLVVAGDSVFATLLVVIIFHQMFEGLALGTRLSLLPARTCSTKLKMLMATLFAAITPIGMAIGVGVLNKFNGNDKTTLIVMGTLDAFSAGILVWVGVVEMWAGDWLHGEMRTSGLMKTVVGGVSLMAGMALMGVLGKWA